MLPLLSLWGHLYGLYNICLVGKGGERLWGEAGAGYLPGSNKVKAWRGRSWFLL